MEKVCIDLQVALVKYAGDALEPALIHGAEVAGAYAGLFATSQISSPWASLTSFNTRPISFISTLPAP